MSRSGLIAAAALAFALALSAPLAAQDTYRPHRVKHPRTVAIYGPYGEPLLPVENALRWGYSQGYSNYPSGFGGLYGDGRYPGNTVAGPHSYNTLR